jgi:chromosome partitioning protein
VLVIDVDPQANATSGLGVDPGWLSRSMYDVFMGGIDGTREITLRDVIRETRSGIDLAPSNLNLVGAEPFFYQTPDRSHILKWVINNLHGYQFILIDTPPSMGQFVINGLVASDRTVVTFDRGIFALTGLHTLMAIFDDIREYTGETIHAEMAIVTRTGQEGSPSPRAGFVEGLKRLLGMETRGGEPQADQLVFEVEEEMRKYFKTVYNVPYSHQIAAAQRRGLPISHYDPECDAAKVYEQIALEVMAWE